VNIKTHEQKLSFPLHPAPFSSLPLSLRHLENTTDTRKMKRKRLIHKSATFEAHKSFKKLMISLETSAETFFKK
jgi:hypothetical protein